MKALIAALAVVLAISTNAVAQPAFPPPPGEGGPPPPIPGPNGWALEPGHWHWDGVRYIWIKRHWTRPGGYGWRFIPGHWGPSPTGPRWYAAHWAPP